MKVLRAAGLAAAVLASPVGSATAAGLPEDFVYLRHVDPSIVQDIRYASANNFAGRPLPGYDAAECVLRRAAAQALQRVQAELSRAGFSLKVFDCYRPHRAVAAMAAWVARGADDQRSQRFHPNLERRRLITLGYIAERSGHSTGNVVDLSLETLPLQPAQPFDPDKTYGPCTGDAGLRAPGDGVDMGTAFDCFDPKSSTAASGLTAQQAAARAMLVKAMAAHGFANYAREWWHFGLSGGGGRPYDFVIPKRE